MGAWNKITIISYYTMKEVLKSKILINVFFIGLAMMIVSFVAAEFTYGTPEKIALDFGLSLLWFSSCGISLFMGVTLISKEIDSRTVYMLISRPVPRYAFVLGKIGGLVSVLLINIALLSIMTLSVFYFLGGNITGIIVWTILYTFIEAVLLLLLVILFSLLANNILSILVALISLFAGHAIQETQGLKFVLERPMLKLILDAYHLVLPGFYKLNLKDFVLYQQTLPSSYLWINLSYGICYSLFVMFVIIFIFNRKNLD